MMSFLAQSNRLVLLCVAGVVGVVETMVAAAAAAEVASRPEEHPAPRVYWVGL